MSNNLKTTIYEQIITNAGGSVDDLPDNLETTYLKRIADLIGNTGGGSGGDSQPLYRHSLLLSGYKETSTYGFARIEIINYSSEAFTLDTFKTYVTEKGVEYNGFNTEYRLHNGVSGFAKNGTNYGGVEYINLVYGKLYLYFCSAYNSTDMVELSKSCTLTDNIMLVE